MPQDRSIGYWDWSDVFAAAVRRARRNKRRYRVFKDMNTDFWYFETVE